MNKLKYLFGAATGLVAFGWGRRIVDRNTLTKRIIQAHTQMASRQQNPLTPEQEKRLHGELRKLSMIDLALLDAFSQYFTLPEGSIPQWNAVKAFKKLQQRVAFQTAYWRIIANTVWAT